MRIRQLLLLVLVSMLNNYTNTTSLSPLKLVQHICSRAILSKTFSTLIRPLLTHKCATVAGITAAALLAFPKNRQLLRSTVQSIGSLLKHCVWKTVRNPWIAVKIPVQFFIKNNERETPLYRAVACGDRDLAEVLVYIDVNLHYNDLERQDSNLLRSPLHVAVLQRNREMTQLLIAAGAAPNRREHNLDMVPLHLAALHNDRESAELLINAGADVNFSDYHNKTPLHIAALHNHTDIIPSLLTVPQLNINASDNERKTSLFLAAEQNNLESVQLLIRGGADLNFCEYTQISPLHEVARRGHTEVARALINAGANINAQDSLGRTPLHMAAISDHVEIVRLLIASGASLHISDRLKRTPLHVAKELGDGSVARAIMDAELGLNS